MPVISVIIPVYNIEKYLPQCLDSVVNQTIKDIEIICVNDGSTDGCVKILQKYAAEDKRIQVINQENKGLSAARNAGLKAATAKYIAFVDSDDFVHPKFLEVLYQAIKTTNCDISGCDFTKIKNHKELKVSGNHKISIFSPAIDVLLNKKNFIHFNVWNKLYNRAVLKDILFAEGIYYEDWIFNTCVFAGVKSFAWVNANYYGYRISKNSIMRSSYSLKKVEDYVTGIKIVHRYMQQKYPNLWQKVKQTRISRTVKMMMNSARRSKNEDIMAETKQALKQLYCEKLIGYRGLSLANKIKLFKFLH